MRTKRKMQVCDIKNLSYVDFMALIEERNRAPGGRDSIRRILLNSFINKDSRVLHIGCNTGISTRTVASYIKCKVIGVDIAPSMIRVAKKITRNEKLNSLVSFEIGDATSLKYPKEYFDLVFSPGSIAFMQDRSKVLNEVVRVIKTYGFFADVPMYYTKQPPDRLINDMNNLMKIKIQKWDLSFWESTYNHNGLEQAYKCENKFNIPTKSKISNYCYQMCKDLPLSPRTRNIAEKRLNKIMNLFAENHKYLSYAVLIYQKVHKREQVTLFGK